MELGDDEQFQRREATSCGRTVKKPRKKDRATQRQEEFRISRND